MVYRKYINEEIFLDYDQNSNLIHYIKKTQEKSGTSKYEEKIKYDNGIKVEVIASDGKELRYEFYKNGKVKRQICYKG